MGLEGHLRGLKGQLRSPGGHLKGLEGYRGPFEGSGGPFEGSGGPTEGSGGPTEWSGGLQGEILLKSCWASGRQILDNWGLNRSTGIEWVNWNPKFKLGVGPLELLVGPFLL